MMETLRDKLESLFEVKQTKYTGKRIALTFLLIVLAAFSLPMYFRYETWVHDTYAAEYHEVKQWVVAYGQDHGTYPLTEKMNLDEEKDLAAFFSENRMNPDRQLYYLDMTAFPKVDDLKYTYVFDPDHQALFTTEYIIYDMKRMHLPGR
ncbi:hypothetical protein [Anoxynatronum sibiricum]|uniref:Uncharacterized protein n=1 Tax=Anoxynatronum sibiricum TaxID=210623 RepID=A0ABU9VXV7_9CLOT